MSTITLKQVTPTGSDLHIVQMGSDIVHDTIANHLAVIKDNITMKTYDLNVGTVFMMNDSGKTIDKYECSKDKPGVAGTTTNALIRVDPLSPIFSFSGKRFVTIGNQTYRLPNMNIGLTAVDAFGSVITKANLNTTRALSKRANLLDLFAFRYQNTKYINIDGGLILVDFVIRNNCDFPQLKYERKLTNDEKLQLFGVHFDPHPELLVYLKDKYYVCNLDNEMYAMVAVEGV